MSRQKDEHEIHIGPSVNNASLEVMEGTVCWDITPYSSSKVNRHFGKNISPPIS
jgi:hypothetical protein